MHGAWQESRGDVLMKVNHTMAQLMTELNAATDEIRRLRAALQEIAEIAPRVIEVQTDYGTDKYTTLVDKNAIMIARKALNGK